MRYQFYREHKYVSAALNDLERVIARTDFCNSTAVEEVKNFLSELTGLLKGHAEYENERLHLLLKQKGSSIFSHTHVEEEHAAQDQQLLAIEQSLQDITKESKREKRIEMGYRLYLAYRKFVSDNLAHLHEEETQILPELQRLYSDSELQQVEAQTYREMTPEQMIDMLGILFPHMNAYDRQAMLLDILTLEPEKFEVVWQAMQHALGHDEWIAIENQRKIQVREFSHWEKK